MTTYERNIIMFNKQTDINADSLKHAIERLFDQLSTTPVDDPKYALIRAEINELYPNRETDAKVASTKRMTPDAKATILANLAGIVMIVNYERAAVLTSKAITLIKTLKN
jgi:hypothetical protein